MSKFVPARASLAALAFALAIPFQAQAAETENGAAQADSAIQADAADDQGDNVIIVPAVSNEEAQEKFPDGWDSPKPYIRIVPQPD